jgi:hypothetical protein
MLLANREPQVAEALVGERELANRLQYGRNCRVDQLAKGIAQAHFAGIP